MSIDLQRPGPRGPLIPGAYERNTLTYRQPRSVEAGTSVPMPIGPGSMPVTGAALTATGTNKSWLAGRSLWFQILRLAGR
jgi:hypothetical protein